MALVQSSDLLLAIGSNAIGHSKDSTFSLEMDLSKSTTKSSSGWEEFIMGVRSGKATFAGLTDYSDTLNFEQLVSYLITRQSVNIFFKDFSGGSFIINGFGFIENVTETAEVEGLTTFDIDFTLTGLISASEQRVWNTIFDYWNQLASQWQNT